MSASRELYFLCFADQGILGVGTKESKAQHTTIGSVSKNLAPFIVANVQKVIIISSAKLLLSFVLFI